MDVFIEGGDGIACLGVTYKVARGRCKGMRRILGEQRRLDGGIGVDTQAGVVGTKDVVYACGSSAGAIGLTRWAIVIVNFS